VSLPTEQPESRLKINSFGNDSQSSKVTPNFMENELMMLQQKIAGLEKKLTQGRMGSLSGGMRLNESEQQTKQETCSNTNDSRLQINLDIYSQNNGNSKEHIKELQTDRHQESFDSDTMRSHLSKTKTNRRSESVTVPTHKAYAVKPSLNKSSSRGTIHTNISNKRSRKPINKSREQESIHKADIIIQSKPTRQSRDTRSSKRYMQQTDSSVKKAKRNASKQLLTSKAAAINLSRTSFAPRSLIQHPNGLLMFLQRFYQYHQYILSQSRHEKIYKLIFFVFCPYMITMMALVKQHMARTSNLR